MRKLATRLPASVRIATALGVLVALLVAAIASGAAPKPNKPTTDKNGALNTVGYPVCKAAEIPSTDSKHALQACEPALIGKGKTTVGIELSSDHPELDAHSDLLVFNAGVKGGVTTLLVHAYLTVPVPAAVVTTVKVSKVHHGRYGTLAVASIPKIAGGSGSVKSFNLKVDKKFTYKGKKVSVLSAKCPDGKLQGKGKAVFFDYNTGQSTTAFAEILRTCTGKG